MLSFSRSSVHESVFVIRWLVWLTDDAESYGLRGVYLQLRSLKGKEWAIHPRSPERKVKDLKNTARA